MGILNTTICPHCLEQTIVITYSKLYSNFDCEKCKEQLCVNKSGMFSFMKYAISGIGLLGTVLGYTFFGDYDDGVMKAIVGSFVSFYLIFVEYIMTRYMLKRRVVRKYKT